MTSLLTTFWKGALGLRARDGGMVALTAGQGKSKGLQMAL